MELDHDFTVPVPVDQAWPVLLDVERIAPCMPGATLDSIDGDEFTGRLKVKLGAMTITYRGSARIASRDEQTRTVTIEGSGKEARGPGTATATVQARLHDEGGQTRVTVHTKLNVTGRPAQFGRNILSEVGGKLIGRFSNNLAAELARDESAPAPAGDTTAATAASASSTLATPPPDTERPSKTPETPVPSPDASPVPSPEASPEASKAAFEGETETVPDTASASAGGSHEDRSPAAVSPASESGGARTAASSSSARPGAEAIDLFEFAGPSIVKRMAPLFAGVVGLWILRRIFRRRR